jgi:hypothetical protein
VVQIDAVHAIMVRNPGGMLKLADDQAHEPLRLAECSGGRDAQAHEPLGLAEYSGWRDAPTHEPLRRMKC